MVVVVVDGEEVSVEVDPDTGPVLLGNRGEFQHKPDYQPYRHLPPPDLRQTWCDRPSSNSGIQKPWRNYTATERKVAIYTAAKKNKARKMIRDSGASQVPSIERNVNKLAEAAASLRAFRQTDESRAELPH